MNNPGNIIQLVVSSGNSTKDSGGVVVVKYVSENPSIGRIEGMGGGGGLTAEICL